MDFFCGIAEVMGFSLVCETCDEEESEEQKAERIVKEELARLNWSARHLKTTHKGDARKIRVARRLRSETTMTLKWIAGRLNMGTWTHLSNRLYHAKVQLTWD
jgi:hypothetical protein